MSERSPFEWRPVGASTRLVLPEALTFADVEHGGFAFSGVDQSPVQIVS